jgi:hypothetical protein
MDRDKSVMLGTVGVLATMAVAGLFLVVGTFLYGMSCQNRAVRLENKFKETVNAVKGSFDNTWRIIEGKAGVASAYSDKLHELTKAVVEGRKGGDTMKMIQETAPGLDPSLYRDVSNAIESQRTYFRNAEKELFAIRQEHNDLRTQIPSSWFVGGRPELVYNVITSARTDKTFETGHDESHADPFTQNKLSAQPAK